MLLTIHCALMRKAVSLSIEVNFSLPLVSDLGYVVTLNRAYILLQCAHTELKYELKIPPCQIPARIQYLGQHISSEQPSYCCYLFWY
jgi:hypothetical protein